MYDLDPDRMMLFYESSDSDWVILRLAMFHYTVFKTDVIDIFEIAGVEIPDWLSEILSRAMHNEYRPIPVAAKAQALPTLKTIRQIIPGRITTDNAYPLFDGYQWGGIALNPGGEPIIVSVPFAAFLCSFTYLGLNFWAQSGMLNGALVLVSQVLLHYKRIPLVRELYPLLDISGYLQGYGLNGAKLWYRPDMQDEESCGDKPSFAHNQVHYAGSGIYTWDRWFYPDIFAMPDIPEGHFLRPTPDQNNWVAKTSWSPTGEARLYLSSDVGTGDLTLLNKTPYGCLPGWPSDEFLAAGGLRNNDEIGIDSFSTIEKIPGGECLNTNAVTNFGDVVVEIEEGGGEPVVEIGGILTPLLLMAQACNALNRLLKDKKAKLYQGDDIRYTVNGTPMTIAGFFVD